MAHETSPDAGSRARRHDRFAHLRAALQTHREVTTSAATIAWCVGCEVHHAAQVGGLCPVCQPVREPVAQPVAQPVAEPVVGPPVEAWPPGGSGHVAA